MKVIFENKLFLTEQQLDKPFMIEGTPVGIIKEVNEENFTVEIWNRFIGVEFIGSMFEGNQEINAVYLSKEKQNSFDSIKMELDMNSVDSIFFKKSK